MLSRRDVLMGAAAAGAAALGGRVSRALAKASQPAARVDFDVPAGACDCHTHVFGDPRHFPFAAGRIYTPEPASVAEKRSLHRALHTGRVVLVQPTVYGTDNSCTLDAMKQLGRSSRGMAVIDEKTPEAALDNMHRGGNSRHPHQSRNRRPNRSRELGGSACRRRSSASRREAGTYKCIRGFR